MEARQRNAVCADPSDLRRKDFFLGFEQFNHFATLLPKDKNALIVAYCGGPKCMAYKQAAKKAEALGYKNVKHLSAGIAGWKEAGEKTEKKS